LQVQLLVRVAEVNRARLRELGASFASVNGDTSVFTNPGGPAGLNRADNGSLFSEFASTALNIFLFNNAIGTQAFIRAMQTQGALRALAEPNLIAMDGQQASFLAGGEYPVPIVQGGGTAGATVTIVFKEYGVRLNFKPTIINEDHIRLELEPEVSTLDFANGVKFSGFLIPGLRTRRAKTGVELRDGQSFALAGLLDNSETKTLSRIPGLSSIPILGNLFKSTSFQKNESELMFIVTAQMVKPVNRDDLPAMPNVENLKKGSLLGIAPQSLIGPKQTAETDGQSGYIINSTPAAPQKSPATEPAPGANPAKPEAAPSVPATSGDKKTGASVSSVLDTNPAPPQVKDPNRP
jgi:pilus assembly protein CpaC